jgi:tetratricopeptide (TPR) repeat protein
MCTLQGAYLKPLTRTELLGTLKTFYGQNLFAEGKIADAQNILDEAEDTSNPQLWYLRGQIQLQQNNKSEALYSFTQAYTLDDQFLDAGDKRAYLLAEERIGDAIELYLELIKKDPNSPRRFHAIGKVLFIRGDYDEAILALERSLQLDSRKLTSYHLLAQCYCKKSDYYQAIECYRHILQIDPKNSGAYKEMGLIYLRIGQEIEASKCFKLAGKYGLSIIK